MNDKDPIIFLYRQNYIQQGENSPLNLNQKNKKRKTFVCKSLLNDTEDLDQTHRFMITNIIFNSTV
jgi:hypothetical protein